jgi:hypothetical protein
MESGLVGRGQNLALVPAPMEDRLNETLVIPGQAANEYGGLVPFGVHERPLLRPPVMIRASQHAMFAGRDERYLP